MKYSILFLLVILFLTSCISSGYGANDKKCLEGVCLSFSVIEPVVALKHTPIEMIITSDKDIDTFNFSIYNAQKIEFCNFSYKTNAFKMINAGRDGFYTWSIKIIPGEKYNITADMIIPAPSPVQPYTSYALSLGITFFDGGHLELHQTFFIGPDGKSMTRAEANKLTLVPIGMTPVPGGIIIGGTLIPFVPTRTPNLENTQDFQIDLITLTPGRTITTTPTITPTPTFQITQPAYPAP